MELGGLSGAVFNGAKERALDHFIAGRIGFLDMAQVVEQVLSQMDADNLLRNADITLDTVQAADHMARQIADIKSKAVSA
jgi:1-deoxy-D-xylulose-5-phosphate reductoisomerase